MDAIELILKDHSNFRRLFKEFERAEVSADESGQEEFIRDLVRELSVHAVMEELFVYPALRERAGQAVLDAIEEHHAVKVSLSELAHMPAGPRRVAKVHLLEKNVRRHLEDEEKSLLPQLESRLDSGRRREMGEMLERARRLAPTRPHPDTPDTPPANFLVNAYAAVYDRSRDALRDGAQMVGAIAARGAKAGLDAARILAIRARRRGGETVSGTLGKGKEAIDEAVGRGRAAVEEVMEKGREAIAEVGAGAREAAARLEVRGRQAAKEVRGGSEIAAKNASGGRNAASRTTRPRGHAR